MQRVARMTPMARIAATEIGSTSSAASVTVAASARTAIGALLRRNARVCDRSTPSRCWFSRRRSISRGSPVTSRRSAARMRTPPRSGPGW